MGYPFPGVISQKLKRSTPNNHTPEFIGGQNTGSFLLRGQGE